MILITWCKAEQDFLLEMAQVDKGFIQNTSQKKNLYLAWDHPGYVFGPSQDNFNLLWDSTVAGKGPDCSFLTFLSDVAWSFIQVGS